MKISMTKARSHGHSNRPYICIAICIVFLGMSQKSFIHWVALNGRHVFSHRSGAENDEINALVGQSEDSCLLLFLLVTLGDFWLIRTSFQQFTFFCLHIVVLCKFLKHSYYQNICYTVLGE